VFGFGERDLHRPPDWLHLEHAHGGEEDFNEGRRLIPQSRQRAQDAVAVGMKHAIVPATRAERVVGVLPDGVQERLKHAKREWLRVLRHKKDVAATPLPHLVDELGEGPGVREVHDRAGFGAVPVAAADDELIPSLREVQHGLIFLPATQTAEFKGVNEHADFCDKVANRRDMPLLTDAREIPHGMIQDNQHIRIVVQHLE